MFVILTIFLITAFITPSYAQKPMNWQLIVPTQLQKEEAVKVAISDLQTYGKEIGITFNVTDDREVIKSNAIILGNQSLNKATEELQNTAIILLKGVEDEQGYEIITIKIDDRKVMVIAGGSVQEREIERSITFKRKNNRSIQKNRNGFAPSIRKQRYAIQPKDLVKFEEKQYQAVGIQNKGAYLKMTDGLKSIVKNMKKIEVVFHQKGVVYA